MSLHRSRDLLEANDAAVALTPEKAQWRYSGLHVLRVDPGEARTLHWVDDELVLVPLIGSFEVQSDHLTVKLAGRNSVFLELTDRVYLPPNTPFSLRSDHGGEIAICTARAEAETQAEYRPKEATSVEVRGAGQATRQVNGVWPADVPGPNKIIVVEVVTPAGNWSSYPPHKHDEFREGETPLEEIYYFRIAGEDGFGFHRTYTADKGIDETVTVRDGDTFLIPRGYHGPSVAAPGYDMYYLNVMAGPQREWLIQFDPVHAWITERWELEPKDPRLPRVGR